MKDNNKTVNHAEYLGWKLGVDFPEWANTEVYIKTISAGYLFEVRKAKRRILESFYHSSKTFR